MHTTSAMCTSTIPIPKELRPFPISKTTTKMHTTSIMCSTSTILIPFIVAAALTLPTTTAILNPFNFPNPIGIGPFGSSRFGLFIHWGAVSQWGSEISFPLSCNSFPCTSQGPNGSTVTLNNVTELQAHRQAYTDLAKTFNPVNFNASLLADLAYNAGFRYLTWVSEHCDNYANFNSIANQNYSIMTSPYGQDTFLAMIKAFRDGKGMRVGSYVCPSFWGRNDYWAPDASTAFGSCCQPNYNPLVNATNAATWQSFVSFLHGELLNLADAYQIQHLWLDSGSYPPTIDTNIESIVMQLRQASPEIVVHVRDGGVWHDYVESVDHSEDDAHDLMGMSYIAPTGVQMNPSSGGNDYTAGHGLWEVPGTLGEQWAYDPHAVYEDAEVVVRKLVGVIAKNGNFLLNIGLDPTGVWAPAAVDVLTNVSLWMSFAKESVHNTTAMWPYEYYHGPLDGDDGIPFTQYFTTSLVDPTISYMFLVDDRAYPIVSTTPVIAPHFKPSQLAQQPKSISYLTPSGEMPLSYVLNDTGIVFTAGQVVQPVPVLLGTYRHNYSSTAVEDIQARDRKDLTWPKPWWWFKEQRVSNVRRAKRNARNGAVEKQQHHQQQKQKEKKQQQQQKRRGALGSESLNRVIAREEFAKQRIATRQENLSAAAVIDNAPCAMRGCDVYTTAGYNLIRNEGVCYRTSSLPNDEPSVPVNLFYNNLDDNMGAIEAPVDGQNWSEVDVECWAYANDGAGRLALQVYHSTQFNDYWTLADPASISEAKSMGYIYVNTVGYIEPTPPGGQLTPAQVEATASSYAYVLKLQW